MMAFGKVITVSESSNITNKEQLMLLDASDAVIHPTLMHELMSLDLILTTVNNSYITPYKSKKQASGCGSSDFVSGMVLGSMFD